MSKYDFKSLLLIHELKIFLKQNSANYRNIVCQNNMGGCGGEKIVLVCVHSIFLDDYSILNKHLFI